MKDGPTDLARRAFASMSGESDGGEAVPKKSPMDSGAVAGKRFADAVKSGDGAAVKAAFKTLLEECQDYEPSEEME
jgi:hypothetical protein